MGIRMTTSASALDAFLQRAARKIQENVLKALSKLGDESVVRIRNRSAKESWIDHTGNLRSSIGFAVYASEDTPFYFYLSQIFSTCMVEIVLYLLASHHFRSAVDDHQLVELCSLYCLSDHITVRIARDLS